MYRGVYETSWGGTYFVSIKKAGRRYYLGTYRDAESAARVYDEAALRLHGKSARLNFSRVDTAAGGDSIHDADVDGSKDDPADHPDQEQSA